MATENPSWGYKRIAGAMAHLGHDLDPKTVANILKQNGLPPSGRRDAESNWAAFIQSHWTTLAALDFGFADPTLHWKRLLKRVEAAGARRIPMRNLRHTFASNHIMAGTTDVQVARWLGHADTKMVHQHYGHLCSFHQDINRLRLPS